MKKYLLARLFLPILLVTFVAGCATTSRAPETTADNRAVITGIKLEDNGLMISSNRHFTFTIYSTDDPYRITVDIPDMSAGSFTRKIESEKAGFTEIIPRQTDGPNPSVKIDIVLQSPVHVEPFYKDNTLTLKVKSEGTSVAAGEAAPSKPENAEAAGAETAKNEPAAGSGTSDPAAAVEKAPDAGQPPAAEVSKEADGGREDMTEAGKAAESDAAHKKATEITDVTLKESAGALEVVIKGNGTMVPNVFPLNKKIVIDVPDVTMKAALPKTVISPLSGIRAGRHKHKTRLVLDLREKTRFEVAAVGDSIVVSLQGKRAAAAKAAHEEQQPSGKEVAKAAPAPPATAEPPVAAAPAKAREGQPEAGKAAAGAGIMPVTGKEVPEEGKYKGKKISLDFQNAEIGPIFRLLADVNGYNLVLDPSVHGKVTIKLMNVPWDQALNIIVNNTTPPLSYRLQGNILWVAPVSKFDALAREKEKLRKTEESVEPLAQEVIRVNYATAAALSSAITQGKLLSPRGSITIDSRMNTLIVKDTRKSIDKIKDLVKIMDVSKPQVMIEAKIVQVSNDYNRTLGIQWGGSFTSQTFPNVVDGNFSVNTPTVAAGPDTDNPGGVLGMTIGHGNTAQISLSLQALETVGKAKILSNPKILTMDNESATIQQGKTFFIPTVSQSGTQTQSQQATLSLTVTPKIAPDGYVQLKVTATNDSLELGSAGVNSVVDTQSLTTQALVGNGQTLVLGGIYKVEEHETETGVPLLGRIPVLGWLFKTQNKVGPSTSELLIFITPRVVKHAM